MKKTMMAVGAALLIANSAMAMPTDGKVVSGASNVSGFSANPKSGTTINVNGDAEILWQNFNIRKGESINFNVKNGCTLKIRSAHGGIVVDGGIGQTGGGKLDFWDTKINVSSNASISADAINMSGRFISASGNFNVKKMFNIYSEVDISTKNSNVNAGEILYVSQGKMTFLDSVLKTSNGQITLVAEKTKDYCLNTATTDNKMEIRNCQLAGGDQIYMHFYNADINDSTLFSSKCIMLNAVNSHEWKAQQKYLMNKKSAANLLNITNSHITASNFLLVDAGRIDFQGNKFSGNSINLFSNNEFSNDKINKVTAENTTLLKNNSFNANSVYSGCGSIVVDDKSYNNKGHYTHSGADFKMDIDVWADSDVTPVTPVSPIKKEENVITAPLVKDVVEVEEKEITLEADGAYTMGDNPTDNVAFAKTNAKNLAMRSILERTGVYVESYSEMMNAKLTTDEIKVISANILKIKDSKFTTESNGDAVVYKCHIVATVNTKDVNLNKIMKDRQKDGNQKKLEDKILELERKYEEIQNKMK